MIERFTVSIADETLSDLRRRLASPRWPIGVTTDGGIPLDDVRELTRYWRDEFDWRRQEERINRFHHVRGSGIHFIHERSSRPPLLLLHGWPGSFPTTEWPP